MYCAITRAWQPFTVKHRAETGTSLTQTMLGAHARPLVHLPQLQAMGLKRSQGPEEVCRHKGMLHVPRYGMCPCLCDSAFSRCDFTNAAGPTGLAGEGELHPSRTPKAKGCSFGNHQAVTVPGERSAMPATREPATPRKPAPGCLHHGINWERPVRRAINSSLWAAPLLICSWSIALAQPLVQAFETRSSRARAILPSYDEQRLRPRERLEAARSHQGCAGNQQWKDMLQLATLDRLIG
ncbi:uncharacterized protein LOC121064958 [Cygnus olor]|uniref:uncharacterized protein LOC121064958 n=1 Tax=Cygnus olor TaxID=8869 RepID=UPI001ADDE9D4|nr:uncharacterized protein LOC121064958 [Cygnus olor]